MDEELTQNVEESGVTPPAAEGAELEQKGEQDPAAEETPKEEMIPLSALEAERRKRQEYEQKVQHYEQYFNQPRQQEQPQDPMQHILRQNGFDGPDDIVTAGQVYNMLSQAMQYSQQQVQNLIARSSEPADISSTLGAVNPLTNQYVPGQALNEYINRHPDQAQQITMMAQNPQFRKMAFQMITSDPGYQKAQEQRTQNQVQQAVRTVQQINQRPASVSSVPGTGDIDRAAQIAQMSPAEFQAYKESITARAG